jgi:SAM-dependent methyltransferase
MAESPGRHPHAVLDLPSRQLKAIKIERLLGLDSTHGMIRMLEVGAGSGGISHYFGTHPSKRYEVHAVDVKDSRVVRESFEFKITADTTLPYSDEHFDVVISNHVIEHVGDEMAQLHHLQELRRVLKYTGNGYLAVPNRWMLIEPHYKLIFLSWWPVGWRSGYLRRMRGIHYYDCRPLELKTLEKLLGSSGFVFSNLGVSAVRAVLDIEGTNGLLERIIDRLPNRLLAWMNPINPTLIYRISRQ